MAEHDFFFASELSFRVCEVSTELRRHLEEAEEGRCDIHDAKACRNALLLHADGAPGAQCLCLEHCRLTQPVEIVPHARTAANAHTCPGIFIRHQQDALAVRDW